MRRGVAQDSDERAPPCVCRPHALKMNTIFRCACDARMHGLAAMNSSLLRQRLLTMDAQQFVDSLRRTQAWIRLAHFDGDRCDGRGWALVLSDDQGIAVMVEDCGAPETTSIKAGAFVRFSRPRKKEPRIVGPPTDFVPASVGQQILGQ